MSHELSSAPAQRRPYEVFGLTEKEALNWRISQDRFQEIFEDDRTVIHDIKPSSNDFGEFLFVTTSRPGQTGRICMTFYGLGYHDQRERWITDEWFWYQTEPFKDLLQRQVDKNEAQAQLIDRLDEIRPQAGLDTQSERGELFEFLADLTDEDGALAEIEDLESLDLWLVFVATQTPPEEPPEMDAEAASIDDSSLLDQASREKLPPLYHGEDRGLDTLAQVKFISPDSNWIWYASEFDGGDIFFGLVSGNALEFGYFTLTELQDARDFLGIQIERDTTFEPKSLGELLDYHQKLRNKNLTG